LDLLLRQQQNAFYPIVIIIELSYRIVYRDNFDLSYRLSIGNSIWHIVTALVLLALWCTKVDQLDLYSQRQVYCRRPTFALSHFIHTFARTSTLYFLGSLKISRRNPCSPFFSVSYSINRHKIL